QARALVGELEAAARRAQGPRLHARHRRTAERDRGGDHARPRTRRGDVGGAAEGRSLREPRPPAGDARRHDPAALLALRGAFERGSRDDPRHVRTRWEGGGDYLTVTAGLSHILPSLKNVG